VSQKPSMPLRVGGGAVATFVVAASLLMFSTSASATEEPATTVSASDVVVATEEQEATPVSEEVADEEATTEESAPESESSTETESTDPVDSDEPVDTAPSEDPVVDDSNESDSEETEETEQPTTETETPSYPTCVENPVWGPYTYDEATVSGTITVNGGEQGQALCDPLAVRSVLRGFMTQEVFPQNLTGYLDVTIGTIGTFSYAAPKPVDCFQGDIHAEFVSKGGFDALPIPPILYGPQNPDEPPFLHETLAGKGPNPTWTVSSTEGCNVPEPEQVEGTATLEVQSCVPGSKNHAVLEATPGGAWMFSSASGSINLTLPVGDGYEGDVPPNFSYEEITIVLNDGDPEDLYEVVPYQTTWIPQEPAACDASAAVVQVGSTCESPSTADFSIENAAWNEEIDLTVGAHTRTATALPDHLFAPQDGSSLGSSTYSVTYTIEEALGYQDDDPTAPCYKAPPTTVDTPDKHDTPDRPSEDLAVTGFDGGATPLNAAIVLTVLGGAIGLIQKARRRQVTAE
jgi:hypothetical protein